MQLDMLCAPRRSKNDPKLAEGCVAVTDEPDIWTQTDTVKANTLDLTLLKIENNIIFLEMEDNFNFF